MVKTNLDVSDSLLLSRRPVKFEHQDNYLHFNLICIDDILSLASQEQSRAVLIVEGDEDGWRDVAHLSFKFNE